MNKIAKSTAATIDKLNLSYYHVKTFIAKHPIKKNDEILVDGFTQSRVFVIRATSQKQACEIAKTESNWNKIDTTDKTCECELIDFGKFDTVLSIFDLIEHNSNGEDKRNTKNSV
jgi:hypothetical protein